MRKIDEHPARVALAIAATLALAACGAAEDTTYEAAVEDESGGELIVRDANPDEVPVDIPDVEMTNVPVSEEESEAE